MIKIAFITDGGENVGMGHVLQSTTLAKLLMDKAEIFFLTKSNENIVAKITGEGFPVLKFENDSDILSCLYLTKPDKIIIDKIDVDEKFAEQVKNFLKAKLVIFTNMTSANRYADVAVTADIGSHFKNLKYIDYSTKTKYFYGPKYWILREEFYQSKINSRSEQDMISKILLIFGGSDPANITSAVLKELLCQETKYNIDVILGASFAHMDAIGSILDSYRGRTKNTRIHRNTDNVAHLMSLADLVIASPGLSCFEALRVGTPVIVMPQNSLQQKTYQGFFSILDRKEVKKLKAVIEKKDFTYPCSEFVKEMEIGEGRTEIVNEILN